MGAFLEFSLSLSHRYTFCIQSVSNPVGCLSNMSKVGPLIICTAVNLAQASKGFPPTFLPSPLFPHRLGPRSYQNSKRDGTWREIPCRGPPGPRRPRHCHLSNLTSHHLPLLQRPRHPALQAAGSMATWSGLALAFCPKTESGSPTGSLTGYRPAVPSGHPVTRSQAPSPLFSCFVSTSALTTLEHDLFLIFLLYCLSSLRE